MKKEDKQMNARYLIMGILGMLCASCNHSTKWDMLVQEGVSRELAEWRKANTESVFWLKFQGSHGSFAYVEQL